MSFMTQDDEYVYSFVIAHNFAQESESTSVEQQKSDWEDLVEEQFVGRIVVSTDKQQESEWEVLQPEQFVASICSFAYGWVDTKIIKKKFFATRKELHDFVIAQEIYVPG